MTMCLDILVFLSLLFPVSLERCPNKSVLLCVISAPFFFLALVLLSYTSFICPSASKLNTPVILGSLRSV